MCYYNIWKNGGCLDLGYDNPRNASRDTNIFNSTASIV